jgi:hypothetical protein
MSKAASAFIPRGSFVKRKRRSLDSSEFFASGDAGLTGISARSDSRSTNL